MWVPADKAHPPGTAASSDASDLLTLARAASVMAHPSSQRERGAIAPGADAGIQSKEIS